jgi:hypothetical protein
MTSCSAPLAMSKDCLDQWEMPFKLQVLRTRARCGEFSGRCAKRARPRGNTHRTLPRKGSVKCVPVFVPVFSSFRVRRRPNVSFAVQQEMGVASQPPLIHSPSRDCHGRGRGFESRRPRHSFKDLGMIGLQSFNPQLNPQFYCTNEVIPTAFRNTPWATRVSSLSCCMYRSSVV